MNKTTHRFELAVPLIFLSLLYASCGGGGSDGGSASLEGTWYGSFTDLNNLVDANTGTMNVIIDADNEVVDIEMDGGSLGLSGSLTRAPGEPDIYEMEASSPTGASLGGCLIVDDARRHAAVILDEGGIAALEKGAWTLPKYFRDDILDKSYEGISVVFDASLGLDEVSDAGMDIFADGSFSGWESGGTNFASLPGKELALIDSNYGVWNAGYQILAPASEGQVMILVTPDKSSFCSAAYTGDPTGIEDLVFGGWQQL
jgi:hypothetical protein